MTGRTERALVDTNAVSDLFRGNRPLSELLAQFPTVYLSVIVLGELLYGYARGAKEDQNAAILAAFVRKPNIVLLPCTPKTAEHYAKIRAALSRNGTLIPMNDMWIAAQAIEMGATIITRDSHFDRVPSVMVAYPD